MRLLLNTVINVKLTCAGLAYIYIRCKPWIVSSSFKFRYSISKVSLIFDFHNRNCYCFSSYYGQNRSIWQLNPCRKSGSRYHNSSFLYKFRISKYYFDTHISIFDIRAALFFMYFGGRICNKVIQE